MLLLVKFVKKDTANLITLAKHFLEIKTRFAYLGHNFVDGK